MYNVIITGATGMVGKGVLLECLDHLIISQVLVINRTPLGLKHDKLKELLLDDFTQLETIKEQLAGYHACFFCLGTSAIGLSEERYTQITFNITKVFADILFDKNPDLVFNYVSGAGTDSTQSKRIMWARVKGKTENYVLNKGFKDAYAFRPGMIIPLRGIKSKTGWYNAIYVVLRPFFGYFKKLDSVTTTTAIGNAMINSITANQELKHLENQDINVLAKTTTV